MRSESVSAAPDGGVTASILIPIRNGGRLLERVVERVDSQVGGVRFELVLLDSGSPAEERRRLRELGARVVELADAFDHGRARDLLAACAAGRILVFLNQDALPVDEGWLGRLVAPFNAADPPVAVQGGIREFPLEELTKVGRRRFFWDSCGPRFYFTSESGDWIGRHGGIGFSTVNCAIARWAWEQEPFGRAPILEDKSWQMRAGARGWRIAEAPDAAVWHTHDYDLRSLLRRCASEGFGWRGIGVGYSLWQALSDVGRRADWAEWRRGRRSGEMRRPAEVLFPLVRPLSLWWGNRWARRVRH